MNVGIIIGRIGGVDGVALETEKWIDVLKRMGHTVYIVSGQYEERRLDPEYETLIPEMSFFSPESYWSQKKAFHQPDTEVQELADHLNLYSKVIYKKLTQWVNQRNIDLLISENASALPFHLEMGLAIKNLALKTGIPTISHDHDFMWERGNRYNSPHPEVEKYLEEHFPLRAPNSIHAVINTNAYNVILERYKRTSVIVPNVMDFDEPFGIINDKNRCLHRDLGYDCEEILLFQITRIVRRKGIETAIKLIRELDDKKIKLIITGDYKDDASIGYYNELLSLIHELHLSDQVRFTSHLFNNKGRPDKEGTLNYSLADAYANATACTYFSTYEGFGNAFVEAVLAKVPVFVNNYKPVYWPDIGSKGFKTVMLEDNLITPGSLKEMQRIIYEEDYNREIAEYNYELGKKYFSYDTLEQKLTELINKAINL